MPAWIVLLISVFVAVCAWQVSAWVHDGESTKTGVVMNGIVDSVDTGSGTLCISHGDSLECYASPGLKAKPGDEVAFVLEKQPIDQDDLGKGKQLTIVSLSEQQQ